MSVTNEDIYKEALHDILKTGRLDVAKEIAADALDVVLEDCLSELEDVLYDSSDYEIGGNGYGEGF